ncbi:FAD-dependent oxidoreductase [Rhodococcus pyridinivorans]|uniref:FAD-dependent oxidoreductase n=1 Tax=Rhodococcus pyridinivorans TaxID=103816 RepID=UPI0031F62961
MAGPAAAHELIERGFEVTVFEPTALGGKARSIPSPGTAAGGRLDLPGEHGFCFFPGFNQHIPDTMRRIPFPGKPERRVRQTRCGTRLPDGDPRHAPLHRPGLHRTAALRHLRPAESAGEPDGGLLPRRLDPAARTRGLHTQTRHVPHQ